MIGEGNGVCMQWPGPRWMEHREVGGGYDRSTGERESEREVDAQRD